MKAKPKVFSQLSDLTLLALALLLAAAVAAPLVLPHWRNHQLVRQSEPIQAALESFRREHGHYPHSLSPLGILETGEGPFYYRRDSESAYQLWLGTSLGESVTFHSSDREWH